MNADVKGRLLLYAALLAASAFLLLLLMLSSLHRIPHTAYTANAPAVEVTPLSPLHDAWLLNSGDARVLEELPGVGEITANRIIACRVADGPFYFPEDIMEVKGIGKKTLEAILTWLVEHPEKAYLFTQ